MIKTKVIETKLVPEGNIIAITLFGLVFTRHKSNVNKYLLNHELIHCKQQIEWLYIPFYILYLIEWIIYFIKYRNWNKAYMSISFEREAYANDRDLSYLKTRKAFANYRSNRKKVK